MTFDHPLAAAAGAAAAGLGGLGMAVSGAPRWRCCSRPAPSLRSCWRWPGRASPCTRPRSRWRCWRIPRPASPRRICRRESAFADKLERARGRHWTRIIPFARATRAPALDERVKDGWQLRHTAGAGGHGTNLEAAIRDGAAALPAGMVPRLLLVSDGNENLGSVARAIWQAQQLGIPVDTVPLAGRPKPGLRAGIGRASRTGLQRRALSRSKSRWNRRAPPRPRSR